MRRDFHSNRYHSLGVSYGKREGFTDAGVGLTYEWNTDDMHRPGGAYLQVGERLGGRALFASLRKGAKASEYVSLEVRAEYLRMTSPVNPQRLYQIVATGSYDLSSERTISTRAVESDEGFNVYFTYRQAVRRGVGGVSMRSLTSRAGGGLCCLRFVQASQPQEVAAMLVAKKFWAQIGLFWPLEPPYWWGRILSRRAHMAQGPSPLTPEYKERTIGTCGIQTDLGFYLLLVCDGSGSGARRVRVV